MDNGSSEESSAPSGATPAAPLQRPHLKNRIAYIPPQCFRATRVEGASRAQNSCYVCHTRSRAPNYVNDGDLQLRLSFPPIARANPWTNLVDPPIAHTPRVDDETVLAYVRQSNYFAADGTIALARALDALPHDWDENGNGTWDGYRPDAWFAFDDHGFDHKPDGSLTGWRAFAYYPVPGASFPSSHGSFGDTLIRLPPAFQHDTDGTFSPTIYTLNLAIVEALVKRVDVPIDPVDESRLGVDLDLDGRVGRANHVVFDAAKDETGKTRMHFVGQAREEERKGALDIAPGLLPLGTEFLHTLHYLDVGPDGVPSMAARMKEVRYARKTRWSSYPISRANAIRDTHEQEDSVDGIHSVHWQKEVGVYNKRGWVLEGFIEAKDGSLRPQTYEETAYCEGCHGGIGATTDNIFSLARKLAGEAPARGWMRGSAGGLRNLAEPKRADGRYEYSLYLKEVRSNSDLSEDPAIAARFFDERGELRPSEEARLHHDVSLLLLPSAKRALDLDRAYLAIVQAQTFDKGREAVLAPSRSFPAEIRLGDPTGVTSSITQELLAR